MPSVAQDFLKLHFVVFLWGFTAVLGKLIELPSLQIVLLRSAAAALFLLLFLGRRASLQTGLAWALIGNGALIGLHWVLFFAAAKISNISICMVGMATVSLWTALLEPVLLDRGKVKPLNLSLGLVIIAAVATIFRSETGHSLGLAVSVMSAWTAALFSTLNGRFARLADRRVVVMYEMAGSAVFCGLVIGVWVLSGLADVPRWTPRPAEWLWLAILVFVCTIYAYDQYVSLLRRLTVYTINFANNLEPIYGIILGALLFGDHRFLSSGFYASAAVIVAAVIFQPILTARYAPEGSMG